MTFLDRVRKSEISRPNQKRFDPKLWEVETSPSEDERTRNLKISGLWFNQAFSKIRDQLGFAADKSISRRDKLLGFVARANFNAMLYQGAVEELSSRTRYMSDEDASSKMIAPELFDDQGIAYSIDEVAQTDIDALHLPIQIVLSDQKIDTSIGKGRVDLDRVAQDYRLGSFYKLLEDHWEDCLWNDYQIDFNENVTLFPGDEFSARWKVVTQYRRNVLTQAMTVNRLTSFHRMYKTMSHQELGIPRPIQSEIVENGTIRYALASENIVDVASSATYMILGEALEPYYDQYTSFRSPSLGGGIMDIIRCWSVLSSLARMLMQSPTTGFDSEIGEQLLISSTARTVDKAALVEAVSDSLNISLEFSSALVDFFVFDHEKKDKKKNELWTQPLLKLDDEKFLVLYTPLLWGTTHRNVNIWLRQIGADLDIRGYSFEKYLRNLIDRQIQTSPLKSSIKFFNGRFKFNLPSGADLEYEDIDFVLLFGGILLVGEIKCFLQPSDTFDTFKHREKVVDACFQLQRKVTNIYRYESTFRKQCQTKGIILPSNLNIQPLVLLNGPAHCGVPYGQTPIVDISILATFLAGFVRQQITSTFKDGVVSEKIQYLYNGIDEAEICLRQYFLNPPQISYINDAVIRKDATAANIHGSIEDICYRHFYVDL